MNKDKEHVLQTISGMCKHGRRFLTPAELGMNEEDFNKWVTALQARFDLVYCDCCGNYVSGKLQIRNGMCYGCLD
jgi:hypothetical protein